VGHKKTAPRRGSLVEFSGLGRDQRTDEVRAAALAFATGARYSNARATGNVSVDRVNAAYFFFLDFLAFFFMAFFFAFGMSGNSSNVSSGSGESTPPKT